MRQYRDFENDPVRFGYEEATKFLAKLHAKHQHYVPIVDSAIYAPNPENPDDAYPPYDRGVEAKAFVLNPDGSIYYGAVWPGYTGCVSPHVSCLATLFEADRQTYSIPRLGGCCSQRHWRR